MLVHGLGTTSDTWYRTIGPLAERYTIVAPDLLGHGGSAGRRVLTKVEPLVRGVEALREALGIERLAVVGHSLGGLVAARYALDHRDRIAKLALVDAGGIGREMSWLLRLSSLPCIGWTVFLPATLTVRLYGRFVFHPPGDVKVSLLKSLHRSRLNHATAEAVRRAVARSVVRLGPAEDNYLLPRLKELDVPVRIFWGQQDRLFPVSQIEDIGAAFPNVRVIVF
jgi:pimeloyl-ACP methyl ester carboxylesterase